MSSRPEDPFDPENPEPDSTVHGQVRHHQMTARVPDFIGPGVFANGVMILAGPFELVLDFVLRLGEQQKIVSRVVLPSPVGQQFLHALRDNIMNFESRFGPLPLAPRPLNGTEEDDLPFASPQQEPAGSGQTDGGNSEALKDMPPGHPENRPVEPVQPQIDQIYDDLKLPDAMLSGRYANAVLIRHSNTEFCFDFITNIYPRSAVSARVLISAPQIAPFVRSLARSVAPPENLPPAGT
jgi:hypothetical protein